MRMGSSIRKRSVPSFEMGSGHRHHKIMMYRIHRGIIMLSYVPMPLFICVTTTGSAVEYYLYGKQNWMAIRRRRFTVNTHHRPLPAPTKVNHVPVKQRVHFHSPLLVSDLQLIVKHFCPRKNSRVMTGIQVSLNISNRKEIFRKNRKMCWISYTTNTPLHNLIWTRMTTSHQILYLTVTTTIYRPETS